MCSNAGQEELVRLRDLPWDSEQLGFPCAELIFTAAPPGPGEEELYKALGQALEAARNSGCRFLTAKVPALLRPLTNACQRTGGSLVDTELSFQKRREAPKAWVPADGVTVEKHATFWDDSFSRLADTLVESRFFIDPMIGAAAARRLWSSSIRNSCTGRASYSLVGYLAGRPAGLINVFEQKGTSDIFLIAVLPEFQGSGVGRAMMAAYEQALGGEVREQTVETQLVNFAAQRLYTRFGYAAVRAKHTFHFWLEPTAPDTTTNKDGK